jgi:hypothetical protein
VKPALLLLAPVIAILALLIGVVLVVSPPDPQEANAATPICLPEVPASATDLHLSDEQRQVAAAIIKVGQGLNVPSRGWVVAIATALQESGLRALSYGDHDSVGVFQQRDAWGPYETRMDPSSSARMFFTGGQADQPGLLDHPGWQSMPVTVAAQEVQVSAYPDAYAKWEPLAVQIVKDLGHGDASCDADQAWAHPLGDAFYVLTAGYGDCGAHWASCHTGEDFAVPTGTPVMSAGDGVVTFAGWNGAYGNSVHVLHAGGVATWYAHLSRIDTSRGARVTAGDVVGAVGTTGNSTGPHLHFEVRRGATDTYDGQPTAPLAWLNQHDL